MAWTQSSPACWMVLSRGRRYCARLNNQQITIMGRCALPHVRGISGGRCHVSPVLWPSPRIRLLSSWREERPRFVQQESTATGADMTGRVRALWRAAMTCWESGPCYCGCRTRAPSCRAWCPRISAARRRGMTAPQTASTRWWIRGRSSDRTWLPWWFVPASGVCSGPRRG